MAGPTGSGGRGRRTQPSIRCLPNRANPLARGLIFFWSHLANVEHVRGIPARSRTANYVMDPVRGYRGTATAQALEFGDPNTYWIQSRNVTVASEFRVPPNDQTIFHRGDSANGDSTWSLEHYLGNMDFRVYSDANFQSRSVTSTNFTVGALERWAATFDGATALLYKDAVQQNSATGTALGNPLRAGAGGRTQIGATDGSTANRAYQGDGIIYCAAWSRILSPEELRSFHDNPWQVLELAEPMGVPAAAPPPAPPAGPRSVPVAGAGPTGAGSVGMYVRGTDTGGGGVSLPTGLAAETDTVLGLGSRVGAGLASETDTAIARSARLATGLATETDTALARSARVGTGLATEVDTAIGRGVTLTTGLASETDTAIARGFTHAPGLAIETDTAIARGATLLTGLSVETDTAFALAVLAGNTLPTGLAIETDTALGLAMRVGTGLSVETDTAIARALRVGTGLASEVDTALGRGLTVGAGLAAETDTAIGRGLTHARGLSLEIDTSFARGLTVGVGRADEVDTAFALGGGPPPPAAGSGFYPFPLRRRRR